MQKRLNMLITLVLALMMIVTSVFAEGADTGADAGASAGQQTETSAPVTSAPATSAPATSAPATSAPVTSAPVTSAPETNAPATSAPVTSAPETNAPATSAPVTNAPETNAPDNSGTPDDSAGSTEDTSGNESTGGGETSTENPTVVPPAEETTDAPASNPTAVPAATPTLEPLATATPTENVPPAGGNEGNAPATPTPTPKPATPAPTTPAPTVNEDLEEDVERPAVSEEAETVQVAPGRRAAWVVLNISMRNLDDERANASMKMAQFILARNVADGNPVSIFFQKKGDSQLKFDKELITSAAEWDALIDTLAQAGYSNKAEGKTRDGIYAFWDFVLSVVNKSPVNTDVYVLQTNAAENDALQGSKPITNFLNTSGISVNFWRFQKENESLDKDEEWLDEMIAELDVSSFAAEPLYYQDVVANPIKQAMKVFDLNLLAPSTDRQTDADGNLIWKHEGMDTLLVLTTDGSPVAVTAQQEAAAGTAFPIVMKMSDTQYMVLLRNVAPGTYNIVCEDKDPGFQVAYKIENAEVTIEGASEDGAATEWFLEDQELVVGLNLPQVKPDDVGKKVLINGVETTTTDGIQFLLKQCDETGMQWVVKIPRQELGEGTIEFSFKMSAEGVEYEVGTDPEAPFRFVVVDRPLAKTADRADFAYYYNVPGFENMPMNIGLAQYFVNPDEQTLLYTVTPDLYKVENNALNYLPEDCTQDIEIQLDVQDLPGAPALKFVVGLTHVDFIDEATQWRTEMSQTEFEAQLGQELEISFTLPANAAQLYAEVCKQYPELPAGLENALHICATRTEGNQADEEALPVELTVQEDGSIEGKLRVPPYYEKKDRVDVTFNVMLLDQTIDDQRIIDACSFTVPNDAPVVKEGIPVSLEINAGIQGAPGKRVPLTFAGVNKAGKGEDVVLPDPFVPVELFTDHVHTDDGLKITIKAEPAELVKLMKLEANEAGEPVTTEVATETAGVWVLDAAEIVKSHELQILDKGTVKVTISIMDDDIPGEQEIVWTFNVNAPFDTTVLIVAIAAAVLAITVIVLLILRQIRKPSFARMNSEMNMRVVTAYSPNSAYTAVPMGVYGKKETDLAHLFIACQQSPLHSMPIDVLADVAVQPGRRRSYRLVLGKKAEKLNVAVEDQAQNIQKPIIFGQDQLVQIYADMNEKLFLQIRAER